MTWRCEGATAAIERGQGHIHSAESGSKVIHRLTVSPGRAGRATPCIRHSDLMRRGTWAHDHTLVAQASTNGVITVGQLAAIGVGDGAVGRRCAPGGPWQRLLPGIVLLHNSIPSNRERSVGAILYARDHAVLTAHAGLAAHGFARWSSTGTVDVLIPHDERRSSTSFVAVERTRRMPAVVARGGLRTATLVRCAVDAGRRTTKLDGCRSLLAEVVQRGDVSVEELAIELAESTTRGTALPRRVIEELGGGAHSVAELLAQRVYSTSGLPPMVFNRPIEDSNGNFVACPDGWLDDVGLAWEIDSLQHHLTVQDHERTILRRARMQKLGIIVVETLPNQLRTNPRLVISDLTANYRLGTQRPRPDVRLSG